MAEILTFIGYTLLCLFLGMVLAMVIWFPSLDPGYNYKWSCEGDEVVIKYADDDEGSYMAGQLCEMVKK